MPHFSVRPARLVQARQKPPVSDPGAQQEKLTFHARGRGVTAAPGWSGRCKATVMFPFAVTPPRFLGVLLRGCGALAETCGGGEGAGGSGRRARGSVGEPLARLLPAAGGAPQVPVLHAVHLAALFALSPRLPARHKGRRRQSGAQRAFPGGLRTPRRMEKGEASSGSARSHLSTGQARCGRHTWLLVCFRHSRAPVRPLVDVPMWPSS